MPKIIVKNNRLRNIAITDIKTVEDFRYCSKYCEMVDNFFDDITQEEIDDEISGGDSICYDDGSTGANFYFWREHPNENSKGCKHFTVQQFRECVEGLESEGEREMSRVKEIISRELLSEVLSVKINDIVNDDNTLNNLFEYEINTGKTNHLGDDTAYRKINIHELANLTVDWIENQGYWIRKPSKNIYELCWGNAAVYSIETEDRLTVLFRCGKWLLTNNKG